MPTKLRAPIVLGCCIAGPVFAQGVCPAPTAGMQEFADSILDDDEVFIGFESAGLNLRTGDSEWFGFRLRYRDGQVTADRATGSDDDIYLLDGNACIIGADSEVCATDGRFDSETRQGAFSSASYNLGVARGSTETIVVDPDGTWTLSELTFTTCPEDDQDWTVRARELQFDRPAGFGTARGVTFIVGRVPVFKVPYISFPIDDRRKSGFLTPEIAERDRTGFDLTIPYYLNLAPNYDLLLEPRYMSDRGVQVSSDFRYLMRHSEGSLLLENLPDDRAADRSRHFVNLDHESNFGQNWQFLTGIEDVSDPAYFEDLGDSLGIISQTHLERFVDLSYYAARWSVATLVHEYQTIDDLIDEADRPYERTPQILFRGRWGTGLVHFESDAETVRFERTVGQTGWRFDSTQELSLQFARAGMYLTPAVALRQTNYRIDDPIPGIDRSPSRSLPVTSIDSGLRFERSAGGGQAWIQTIEPRVLYVNVPFEDQSDLPVFDTLIPDFNLVQLFRKYEYVGPDRLADTDRFSVGVTTRLIESASGRERVTATIGQSRYREARRVMLPDETPSDTNRSNYVAELGIDLTAQWNLDVGYQWNGDTNRTVRSEARFEFRPQDDRLFGIGYRERRGVLEQGDLSMVWPIFDRWRLIGQYSYSLLEDKPLERFTGIEYEACCWRMRLTTRRYIVRSTGATDSSVSIQLELKGLGRPSESAADLLGRGILGYRPLN